MISVSIKVLAVVLALVVGILAVALVWINYAQAQELALLRAQNALLRAQVALERQLNARQGALNAAYDQLLTKAATWLGLDTPKALGAR